MYIYLIDFAKTPKFMSVGLGVNFVTLAKQSRFNTKKNQHVRYTKEAE